MKPVFLSVFMLLLLLVCGCCNFASLEGNGSGTRREWEAYLPTSTPQQIEQIRIEAESSDVTLSFERGAYIGYKAKLHREFVWSVPVGPYRERSFWMPDAKRGGRSLCVKTDCWGTTILPFLAGLFVAGDSEVYDYPRGDCLAYQRFMRAGIIPLVAYESSLMPVTKEQQMPGCPNVMAPDSLCRITTSLDGVKQDQMGVCYVWPSTSLNRIKYDRLTSYYFLCGLFAFGQKNDRAYMQLAWIPIPLWSLEEKPALAFWK
jgi:hypothetical protein